MDAAEIEVSSAREHKCKLCACCVAVIVFVVLIGIAVVVFFKVTEDDQCKIFVMGGNVSDKEAVRELRLKGDELHFGDPIIIEGLALGGRRGQLTFRLGNSTVLVVGGGYPDPNELGLKEAKVSYLVDLEEGKATRPSAFVGQNMGGTLHNGVPVVCGGIAEPIDPDNMPQGWETRRAKTCWEWKEDEWQWHSNLTSVLQGGVLVSANGQLHALGLGLVVQRMTAVYDEAQMAWLPGPNLTASRMFSAAFELGGSIIICGGEDEDERKQPTCEELAKGGDQWKAMGSVLHTARSGFAAAPAGKKRVLVVGGTGNETTALEVFRDGKWLPLSNPSDHTLDGVSVIDVCD